MRHLTWLQPREAIAICGLQNRILGATRFPAAAVSVRFYLRAAPRCRRVRIPTAATVNGTYAQRRYESTATTFTPGGGKDGSSQANKKGGPGGGPRRPTFGEILRTLFRDSLGSLSRAVRGENFRNIFRQHPGEMTLALVS